jgi:SAM-dependent methyltransferase
MLAHVSTDASWVAAMPEEYDRHLVPALFAPWAELLAQAVATLAPARVLELAAGTGVATAAMLRALPGADVVATDLNAAMVDWAAVRVPGATWQQADAQALDLPDAAFDLVACQFGVMFFPDRPAAYSEARRVLAPGGTLLFTTWDRAELSDFPDALTASLAAVFPDDPPSFLLRLPHGYADPDQVRADLAAGGFTDVAVVHQVPRGTAPSAAAVTRGYCMGSPLRFELEARGPLEELTAALAADMSARLGPGPVESDLPAYLVTARRD